MLSQTAVQLHHGILLRNKQEQTIETCNNLDDFPGNYAE